MSSKKLPRILNWGGAGRCIEFYELLEGFKPIANHGATENAEFLKNFLGALGVSVVSLLLFSQN
jgi:hypothetical protein